MIGRGRRVMRRRAMVGTAVGVAATASMVSGARRNRAERKALEQQTEMMEDSQAAQNQSGVDTAAQPSELTQKLQELADLRDQGILTEEEFQAKKKQLLGL